MNPEGVATLRRRAVIGASALAGLAAIRGAVALNHSVGSAPSFRGVSIKELPAYQDRGLLERAWTLPVARRFQHHVVSQSNSSSCGPSSLANVQRSFGVASTEASLLTGSDRCWFGVCPGGFTLDELAELARTSTGRTVTVLRDLTYQQFEQQLKLSADPSRRTVINFHRTPLFGKGLGHFSPIGGFLEDRGLVLVLDVNANYQPFLVDAVRLYEAMETTDASSGRTRGLLIIDEGTPAAFPARPPAWHRGAVSPECDGQMSLWKV